MGDLLPNLSAKNLQGKSIHPRVKNGRAIMSKVNTAAPEGNPPGKCLRKTRKRLEVRRHNHDLMVQKMTPGDAAGYRKPGSMKP